MGENEKSLKEKEIPYNVKKLFLKSLGMPKIKGNDSGFVKLLFDEREFLIGASLVGYDMTEIINQVAICIKVNTKPMMDRKKIGQEKITMALTEM